MFAEDYQNLAMRTSPDGHDRVLNGCLGLIGESGELVDLVKKWRFQSGDNAEFPKEKLILECGDILWYCAELMTGINENLFNVVSETSLNYVSLINNIDKVKSVECNAGMIALFASRPFELLSSAAGISFDVMAEDIKIYFAKNTCAYVGWIVNILAYFLEKFCESSLKEASDRNIQKLKARYPDGFDPERSLHREEQEP